MDLAGKKVLITGAAGFIGSHLVQKLIHRGANVYAFVKYSSLGNRGFLGDLTIEEQSAIKVIFGDLKDSDSVRQAVKGMDVVLHLGALIAIPYSYLNPKDAVQTNVLGTLNVLQAVREYDVARMVHTSTSEVYGTAQYVPMCEKHPLQGQSPYSASKIGADKIVESFYCSYNTPVVTLRPFNSYGPRQSMRAVIPTIINQALHCDEIVLGNLDTTRDFTYAEDSAEAFIAAACSMTGTGDVFNAGSGFEISIEEIVTKVKTIVGRDIPIRIDESRVRPEKSEVDRLFSDSSKAAEQLGWKAEISFEEGLARTIDWIKANPTYFRPKEYVI